MNVMSGTVWNCFVTPNFLSQIITLIRHETLFSLFDYLHIHNFIFTLYIEINFLSFKCHFWNFGMTLLYAMTCFGLFTKIEKGVWYQFLCTCSAWFFNKSISYLIFYQSKSYLFSFSRYQTNCFMKFLFRQLVTS